MSTVPDTVTPSSVLPATLSDVRTAALDLLSEPLRGFLEGGAGDETTLRRNRLAFERWQLIPRMMHGGPTPGTASSFLGVPLSLPVLTAPFGADALFHPDGHLAVTRANAAAGVVGIVPEAGSFSLERVAAAVPGAPMFAQLHPAGDEIHFRHMLERIERAGYRGVCVTVDCPTGGWRERLRRDPVDLSAVIAGNYVDDTGVLPEDVFGQLFDRTGAGVWSWQHLGEIMADCSLPWAAKGVLTATDAEAAIEAGASAVIVSNHGGRQLDLVPSALEQLPDIARAVHGRAQIGLDSGIRRGSDVVMALALGADVVIIGRLAVYGLVVGGEAGVRHVHELLREEMTTVLTLLGRGSAAQLDQDAVREAPRW